MFLHENRTFKGSARMPHLAHISIRKT